MFLQLLSPSGFGVRMVEVAEALETPPSNPVARRYAGGAVGCLLAGAALLVSAALVDSLAHRRPLSEKLGWGGVAWLIVCVYCGLCFKDAQRMSGPGKTD